VCAQFEARLANGKLALKLPSLAPPVCVNVAMYVKHTSAFAQDRKQKTADMSRVTAKNQPFFGIDAGKGRGIFSSMNAVFCLARFAEVRSRKFVRCIGMCLMLLARTAARVQASPQIGQLPWKIGTSAQAGPGKCWLHWNQVRRSSLPANPTGHKK
jgi:hypothetical protein